MSEFNVNVDLVESFVVEIQEDLDDKTGIVVGRTGEFDTQTMMAILRVVVRAED